MGRFLRIVFFFILFLVALALIAPFFIPTSVYRDQIETAVERSTGRELTIGGDVSISFFPPVMIDLNDVTLSNAPGASEPLMAEIKTLSAGVAVLPFLFENRLEVTRFVLTDPKINLEVSPNGTPNWTFDGADTAAAQPAQASTAATTSTAGPTVSDVSFGQVELVNGEIHYLDRQTDTRYDASEIGVIVGLPSIDGPLALDGSAVYNGERITADLDIGNLRQFLDAQATALTADISSDLVTVDFSGQGALATAANAALPVASTGTVDLNVPSVRALSAWTGSPIESPGGFGPLSVNGGVTTTASAADFTNATLRFDEINGTGDFKLALDGPRPKLTGTLAVDELDTRPYTDTPVGQAAAATESAANGAAGLLRAPTAQNAPAAPLEWSTDPLDLSGLRSLDADLDIAVGSFSTSTIQMGQSALDLIINNGLLTADLEEVSLYEGSGRLFLEVNARQRVSQIRNQVRFNLIQTQPLLRDLIQSGILSGIGNLEYDVRASGVSQRDLVAALTGAGTLKFENGALFGVNLAQLVRRPADSIAQMTLNLSRPDLENSEQKTDFAEMGASFVIQNGVFQTEDFQLLNPLLRLLGAGNTNLVDRSVDFVLDPRAVTSLEGQGGQADLSGIGIPVRIRGTWENLSFEPDVRGIGRSLIERELGEGAGDILDNPEGAIQRGLEDLLRGGSDEEDSSEEESSPGDVIRGLFGGSRPNRDDDEEDEEEEGGDGGSRN